MVLPDQQTAINSRAAAVELFLWLFHYLYDTSVDPSFDSRTQSNWQAYREVNACFSRSLAALHTNSSDEVVLVHDFHLMLVPGLFTALVKRRNSQLAYFHHVPWCDPGYFGLLPDEIRRAVLGSLLECDFTGFHSQRWAENFKHCCQRYLRGAEVAGDIITYRDHPTVVRVAPGPIDAATVHELTDSQLAHRWRELLESRAGHRRIVARVDRLDLWKNIVRGFNAYEFVLERSPSIADEYWFCAIVSSPRFPTPRHAVYEARCREAQTRINARYGSAAEAVSMLYPSGTNNHRTRALAALSLADVVLVNPTFDGLNMVAKEALVANPKAPLLLSRNAGAFDQLSPAVIAVDPFDVLSTGDLLATAMSGTSLPPAEDRAADLEALQGESARGWLDQILDG